MPVVNKAQFRKLDEKEGIKGLKLLITMFNENDVEYWIDCGNLLGAIRDQKFIPWDTDIDISIIYDNDEIPKIFIKELKSKKFKVETIPERWIGMEKKGYPHMDIDLFKLPRETKIIAMMLYYLPTFVRKAMILGIQKFYSENEKIRPSINEKRDADKFSRGMRLLLPIFFCGKLDTIQFYDMTVSVPRKAEELLCMRYGFDWRIPKRTFKSYTV